MCHSIMYGNKKIYYTIIESERKTLAITVNPNLSVIINTPIKKEIEEVHKRVKKRARWINEKLLFFQSLPKNNSKKMFESGESFKYLGKQYRIKIVEDKIEKVKLKGMFIFIYTNDIDNKKKIEKLLNTWYLLRANNRFNIYKRECLNKIKNHVKINPEIKIKKLKTKWGSCNRNNMITLNIDLIKHSPLSIKYVLYHELCHLKYYNHDKNFYNLLSIVLPDWKNRKKILEFTEV